jgi:hypothetical protein
MAKSPIQIVLNSSDFISMWDRPPGGDKEFVVHQSKLSNQLAQIEEKQTKNKFSDITYAKVILKQSGIAKSHRPTDVLFNNNNAPVVGAGDLGEIFVELEPGSIKPLIKKINQAETVTKYKEKTVGDKVKSVASPTSLRSEVGAIEDIRAHTPSDKRKFSVEQGIEWLSNPQTGGAYIVEVFEAPPSPQNFDNISASKRKLFNSFTQGLLEFGVGMFAAKISDTAKSTPMFAVRLEDGRDEATVHLIPVRSAAKKSDKPISISKNKSRHLALLNFLDEHPLVRKIILPPLISRSENVSPTPKVGRIHSVSKVDPKKKYPKLGIVDGGISRVFKDWVEESWGLLSTQDRDEEHGTFIAGLAISGKTLNGNQICQELDGCKIIDLDVLPKEGLWENYYTEPLQIFKEVESAVKMLKAKTGVRIFNFSLNFEEHVSTEGYYSLPARMLDEIAEENDVIFVISAGNTHHSSIRTEWPTDDLSALKILATSRKDTIKTPAESYRNLSVSAVNPPAMTGIVPHALSNYSCRGPGMRIGLKPDLAHVGGSGTKDINGHGLLSLDTHGKIVDGCGTSFSTPIVAKTLACLDEEIEGTVSRESLMALVIHNAVIPNIFKSKSLKEVAKDLIGFGIPCGSEEMLDGKDNAITLVFANRIYPGKRLSFNFSWPPSLVKANKCYGHARLTIVSTPPFNYKYGAEFVRVNIQGSLRQQQKNGNYNGKLKPLYLPDGSAGSMYEKNQITQAFKWSPIKVFEKDFSNGTGPTTNWKLEVEFLTRDGEQVPSVGIPFTAMLTITDPNGNGQVFNEMRQLLQAQGVQVLDIKTAARVLPRV